MWAKRKSGLLSSSGQTTLWVEWKPDQKPDSGANWWTQEHVPYNGRFSGVMKWSVVGAQWRVLEERQLRHNVPVYRQGFTKGVDPLKVLHFFGQAFRLVPLRELENEDLVPVFRLLFGVDQGFIVSFERSNISFSVLFRVLRQRTSPPSISSTWMTAYLPVSGFPSASTCPAVDFCWTISRKNSWCNLRTMRSIDWYLDAITVSVLTLEDCSWKKWN